MRCCFCQQCIISYWPCSEDNVKQCYHCMSDYGLGNVIFFISSKIEYVHFWIKVGEHRYLVVQSIIDNWTDVYLKTSLDQFRLIHADSLLFTPANIKSKLSTLLPFL